MTRHEKLTIGICAAVVIIAVALVYSCQSVAQEHGGQTLMRLARRSKPNLVVTPSIMPPTNTVKERSFAAVPRTNAPMNYLVAFPPTEAGKLYSLWRSTNLINWTMIRSNMVGPSSTNSDVFTTNRYKGAEYFQLRRQTNYFK